MKTINILLIASFIMAFCSCKKNNENKGASKIATVNVINAVIDLGAIKINPTSKKVSWSIITDQVNYGSGKLYYAEAEQRNIRVVRATDTNYVVFEKNINFKQAVYTVCFFGTLTNIDTMVYEEKSIPYIQLDIVRPSTTDSVVNVRFVNLSINSPKLKINIKNSIINEVDNLGYKSISAWKSYANKAVGTTSYIFEIRDAATNAILTTYTFNATATNRFKNVALILRGMFGTTTGTAPFGVSSINYF